MMLSWIKNSQLSIVLWRKQKCKAKYLYKMFIFRKLCGLVFGGTHPTRITKELKMVTTKPGSWPLAAPPLRTPDHTGACPAHRVGGSKCCGFSWHTLRTYMMYTDPPPMVQSLLPSPSHESTHTLTVLSSRSTVEPGCSF